MEATVGHCLLEADVRADLSAVVAPTLVVQGELTWDDRPLAAADDASLALMRASIDDLAVTVIPGAHPAYVLVQEPARCAREAMAFLDAYPLG